MGSKFFLKQRSCYSQGRLLEGRAQKLGWARAPSEGSGASEEFKSCSGTPGTCPVYLYGQWVELVL